MDINLILELSGVVIIILINLLAITVFISKLSNRVQTLEENIKVLFQNDKTHSSELNLLYEIKGQLELLIKHNALIK